MGPLLRISMDFHLVNYPSCSALAGHFNHFSSFQKSFSRWVVQNPAQLAVHGHINKVDTCHKKCLRGMSTVRGVIFRQQSPHRSREHGSSIETAAGSESMVP